MSAGCPGRCEGSTTDGMDRALYAGLCHEVLLAKGPYYYYYYYYSSESEVGLKPDDRVLLR